MRHFVQGCQLCTIILQNRTSIDLIKKIINKSDKVALYAQVFQKQGVSLNQSCNSVSHLNMVTWQKRCHTERQADTCGEEPASVLEEVLTDPLHLETHQEKHPDIA